MMVPSNENVTERRGGQGDPAREQGRLDPLAARRFCGCDLLLSVVRPPSRCGPVLHPRAQPNPYRSLPVTAGDWSAHTEPASAPAALDSELRWRADVERRLGLI